MANDPQKSATTEPNQTREKLTGRATFRTFSHLLNSATSLQAVALADQHGSADCFCAAAVFTAFAFEAYLNHLGEELVPDWMIKERSLRGWKGKVAVISEQLRLPAPDFEQRPLKTLFDLFQFRDSLAHGRTSRDAEIEFYMPPVAGDPPIGNPDWLNEYSTPASVARAIEDANAAISALNEASGLLEDLSWISTASWVKPARPPESP